MSLENEYLSDEELNALINEIEQGDLVMAPPGIREKVLEEARSKNTDFIRYCFQVVASAAAAIILLFLLPAVSKDMMPKVTGDYEEKIPTREEVLATQQYATREEVLDDTSVLQKLFQSISIWEQNIEFDFFKKESGGE